MSLLTKWKHMDGVCNQNLLSSLKIRSSAIWCVHSFPLRINSCWVCCNLKWQDNLSPETLQDQTPVNKDLFGEVWMLPHRKARVVWHYCCHQLHYNQQIPVLLGTVIDLNHIPTNTPLPLLIDVLLTMKLPWVMCACYHSHRQKPKLEVGYFLVDA